MTHERRTELRLEIDRRVRLKFSPDGVIRGTPGRPMDFDPEAEGRAAFASIGQPWPGDVVMAQAA